MAINLTNRNDIICDSLVILSNNNPRVDVGTSINQINNTITSVVGLPVATLNSLEKVAIAINNDPQFFTNMQASINTRAPIIIRRWKYEIQPY